MAFRNLVLVSLLLLGSTAHSVESADAAADGINAVNSALAKQKLVLIKGVPVLKPR